VAEIVPLVQGEPPSIASLIALCRRSLAAYKIPVDFRFVEALPRTASGKIRR
jgi:feruloyl-CoA synthase